MAGILPVLDGLADGSDLPALERLLRTLPAIENARARRGAPPLRQAGAERKGDTDGHRRRAPSHLAAGRPALAAGADGAAHLRPVRADPPRLSDRGIPGRHRRLGRREIRLRADQLGKGRRRRGRSNGCRASPTSMAGRTPIVGYADLLDDDVLRHAEAAGALSADARHPHAAALARQRDVPLRRGARPDERPALPRESAPRRRPGLVVRPAGLHLADGRRRAACRRQSRHHFRAAACRHAGGPLARGPRRLARRHEASRRPGEHRLETLRPRHLHPPQRRRAHQRMSCCRRSSCSAPSAACSAAISRSRNCGRAMPISSPRTARRSLRCPTPTSRRSSRGTATRVYRL